MCGLGVTEGETKHSGSQSKRLKSPLPIETDQFFFSANTNFYHNLIRNYWKV
jgi:hypothetical protein